MRRHSFTASIFVIAAIFIMPSIVSHAQTGEPRLALIIGNAQYRNASPLATTANDAGLIAQTLTTAGFDVTGAADLDQDSMRRAFRDFLNKVEAAGPHAITFVYLAGYGLQYAGENYFIPVDASLARDTDIPVEAIRVSDFTSALAGMPLEARIFVLDAARANPFPTKGNPLAGGLALIDVDANSLDAFNAAPGTIAPEQKPPYGAYARALAEMLRYGGVPLDEVFARTRLRVNELTHGAFVPWDASKLSPPLVLLAGNPDAAPLPGMQDYQALRSRPVRDFPTADEAYAAAVEIDTLSAYQEFLSAYPTDPLAGRVRALLAARREALTWNRTVLANTPDAYWSYMRRYPRGPHYWDARRRLGMFSVALEPPPRFDMYDFQGLPPPPEDEYIIVDRPVLYFEGPDYAPAPPPPPYFLPPPPVEFRRLSAPEPGPSGFLPAPAVIPLPFARPAQQPGTISLPNLAPASGGRVSPPAGAPTGAPGQGQPNPLQPNPLLVPQGAGALAAPQAQPNVVTPRVPPAPAAAPAGAPPAGTPPGIRPNVATPNAVPAPNAALRQQGGQTRPTAVPNHALPTPPPQSNPAVVPRQVRPQTVAPPAAAPKVAPSALRAAPSRPAPQVETPHPAPRVVAPPHPQPQAAPHPVPQSARRAAPPAPAPHPAAAPPPQAQRPAAPPAPRPAPPHPAPPPPAAKPAPPKPGDKKNEPPH